MKVAFYKGDMYGTLLDGVVCWWICSSYSHVALVVEDTWYTSTPTKGVHKYQQANYNPNEWEFVEVYDDAFECVTKAEKLLGAKYDYMGLFGFVLRPAEEASSRWFCSEFVAHCLGFSDAWRYDPATLYSSLTYCKK